MGFFVFLLVLSLDAVKAEAIAAMMLWSTSRIVARIAFLMAFGDERPWLIITTPLTPNKGAPPPSL